MYVCEEFMEDDGNEHSKQHQSDSDNIMVYATHITESELVYVKIRVPLQNHALRQRLRVGFIPTQPLFIDSTDIQRVYETFSENVNMASKTSRWHIYHCIYSHQDRSVLKFYIKQRQVCVLVVFSFL